ncbi:MAG: SDR family oxidoreductase [Defluviitaleaceae bacterium]|nr:SDR family oxidoreductase [Defluviitaleaceae bacterium]
MKTAVVTGGNKGVGRGIVYKLINAGINVCFTYNSNEEYAVETLNEAEKINKSCVCSFKCDVTQNDQVEALMQTASERFGGIDILINNAALQKNMPFHLYNADQFKQIWDINIGGYLSCMRACFKYLKASPCPRVVNVSSVHAKRPAQFDPVYAVTKSAVKMLTREAAVEWGQYKITVNCIELGATLIEQKTGLNFPMKPKTELDEERFAFYRKSLLLGRTVMPSDAGELVLFLVSEKAEIITGSAIRMDGGNILR